MNIFKLDFRGVHVSRVETAADSTATGDSTLSANNTRPDSTKALDSLSTIAQNLNPEKDSTKTADNKEAKTEEKPVTDNKNSNSQNATTQNNAVPVKPEDSNNSKQGFVSGDASKIDPKAYDKWKKDMAKIMEIMDSKKASQLLRTYSDNIARDIFLL